MRWQWCEAATLADAERDTRSLSAAATVIVMPSIDQVQAERAAAQLCRRAGVEDAELLLVDDTDRRGFIAVANSCFRATESVYFGYLAQDAFGGRDWLNLGIRTLIQHGANLLGFNDGKWRGMLAAFGLGRRTWLAGNYGGKLFYPEYISHYADTELTLLAMAQQGYVHHPHALVMEVDWNKESKGVNRQDKALFAQRKGGELARKIQDPKILNLFS